MYGKFNDRYFHYIAAFGICPEIAYTTKQDEKNKFGRLAYYMKAFKDFSKIKTYKATIVTDDEIIKDEFIYGGISNSISIGGFKWFKRSAINVNDGVFELILIKKTKNFWGLLKIICSILKNKYDQKNIYYLQTKHLQIDFAENVSWTLDGEFGGKLKHILIENHRNKIDLLVPKK